MTQTPSTTFKGRELAIRLPNGAQVLVWNRVVKQFNELATELEGLPEGEKIPDEIQPQYRKALNRLSDMIFGMLDSEDDREWLEDQILEGSVVDTDLLAMLTDIGDAIEKSGEGGNVVKPARKKSAAQRTKS